MQHRLQHLEFVLYNDPYDTFDTSTNFI